ncbi:MAG: PEP-CTERM sorting domain-containing protein [Planctomycetales bacterium]|nr:PEP-CTERM sorting domain-containing protein [Planctomycetales bacterium]
MGFHLRSLCVLCSLISAFVATESHADIIRWNFFSGTLVGSLDGDNTLEGYVEFDDANPNFNPGSSSLPTEANGGVTAYSFTLGFTTWDSTNTGPFGGAFPDVFAWSSFVPGASGAPPSSFGSTAPFGLIMTAHQTPGSANRIDMTKADNGSLLGHFYVGGTDIFYNNGTFSVAVPEPSSVGLIGMGVVCLSGIRKRRLHVAS